MGGSEASSFYALSGGGGGLQGGPSPTRGSAAVALRGMLPRGPRGGPAAAAPTLPDQQNLGGVGVSYAASPYGEGGSALGPTTGARGAKARLRAALGGGGVDGSVLGAPSNPLAIEELDSVLARMSSADWRERAAAIDELVVFCGRERATLGSAVLKVAGDVGARLLDSNNKVSLAAMTAVTTLIPLLRGEEVDRAAPVLIPGLAGALGASARPVSEGANAALDRLLSSGDPAVLLGPLTGQLRTSSSPRLRAALLEKIAGILPVAHARRPAVVVRVALPAIFALLDDSKPDVKTGVADVLLRAAQCVGVDAVLEAARGAALTEPQQEKVRRALRNAAQMWGR